MPPQNIGGGQFGQATGGADALRAAMQKRGMDASILDQVSATAPTGPSEVAPALPEGTGAGGQPAQAVGTLQAPEQPFRSREMEIALKALNSVVSTENSIVKQALSLGVK